MNIYRYHYDDDFKAASNSIAVYGSLYPVIINGVIFNKDNPYYVITSASGGSPSTRVTSPFLIAENETTKLYNISSSINPTFCYGFPGVIYTQNVFPYPKYVDKVYTTTISGKYKFKTSKSFEEIYLSEFCVDVNVLINDVKYCALCCSYGNSDGTANWNDPSRLRFMGNRTNSRVVVGYKEPSPIGEVPVGYTSFCDAPNSFKDNYVGSIWDFGSNEQIVPTAFKNWIEKHAVVIYDNSYTVKNNNGEITFDRLQDAPPVVSEALSVSNDRKELVLTGANGSDYTMSWNSLSPEGKVFVGLSFEPDSKFVNIQIGVDNKFALSGDVIFYECYETYRPIEKSFVLTLYKNKSEANRVDKTEYLTNVGTLNGALRSESSITKPVIIFESLDIPVFNYVHIPIFSRYYFVNDITSIRYKLWQISLSVDPLMTYKDAIMQCVGFIDRNEYEFNAGIIDKKRAIEQGRTMEVDSVTNELFGFPDNGSYVLEGLFVAGGEE